MTAASAQTTPLPPHNLEAEEYVLGAMMLAPWVIDAIRPALQPGDFWRETNGLIYRAALDLHDIGAPVDVLTIIAELEQRGDLTKIDGGKDRIREIATLALAPANAPHHAALIADAAKFRQIIQTGEAIARIGWDPEGDAEAKYAEARARAADLEQPRTATLDIETWHRFEAQAHDDIPVLIDQLFPEAAFAFIGAPPKKGKTWVALAVAVALAAGKPLFGHFNIPNPRPVLYVALEGHRAALRARVGAIARGMGIDPDGPDLDNLHWLYKPRGINLADPIWAYRLRQGANRIDAALTIVDVMRAGARIKENDQEAFGQLRANLQPITDDGRAIAMLHHNIKLTEISKERDPGERLSGSGAMYGALDVGIYITGSQNHATELRLAFDLRDLTTPDDISIHLEGEGTGPGGGYGYRDTAAFRVVDHDEVAEDDLKAAPTDLYDWLIQHGGEATSVEILAAHEIVDRTLRRREQRLAELGVEITRKRGVATHYRVLTPQEIAERDQTQMTLGDPGHTPDMDTTDTSPGLAMSGVETPNDAGLRDTPDTPDIQTAPTSESGDLQAEPTPDTPDSPLGSARTRARAHETHPPNGADRLAAQRAWLDQGHWMDDPLDQAILTAYPMTSVGDIPTLLDHAAKLAEHELGG